MTESLTKTDNKQKCRSINYPKEVFGPLVLQLKRIKGL